jgi:two-component system OmpR family response regulator
MNTPRKLMLVVEDDSWTRSALASILKHKGCDVRVASSVVQGLELLKESVPDCIILDLTLPDGSGELILRHVREEGLTTRVVVCTAIHDARRLEGVRSLRPDALFVKPIDVDEILGACCEVKASESDNLHPIPASH